MKINTLARLTLAAGLVAGGAAASVAAPAQATKDGAREEWAQSDKACKVQLAGTVCLEKRTSSETGESRSRMVLRPEKGRWIRPDVHASFGLDFGTEDGACGPKACAKVTEPMTSEWIPQGDEIRGLGYSTPQGTFDIYLGRRSSS